MRVADADQLVLSHDNQRVRALDPLKTLHKVVVAIVGWSRHQVQNNLAIDCRLENGTVQLQLLAKLCSVCEVAIVRDCNLPLATIDRQGLGIAVVRRAGSGVACVTDCHAALEVGERLALEYLRHQPHAFVHAKLSLSAGDDTGALLPAVL